MTRSPNARLRRQRGVTTAEYAVVTAAGCGFGAVLIALLKSPCRARLGPARVLAIPSRAHLGPHQEVIMTRSPNARLRNERGVTTAEYAVVTAAGCGFASVLIKLLTSDFGQQLLKTLFALVLKVIGI